MVRRQLELAFAWRILCCSSRLWLCDNGTCPESYYLEQSIERRILMGLMWRPTFEGIHLMYRVKSMIDAEYQDFLSWWKNGNNAKLCNNQPEFSVSIESTHIPSNIIDAVKQLRLQLPRYTSFKAFPFTESVLCGSINFNVTFILFWAEMRRKLGVASSVILLTVLQCLINQVSLDILHLSISSFYQTSPALVKVTFEMDKFVTVF